MKKLFLGLGLMLTGAIAQAQNGLEGIIVEKYYVSNASDASFIAGTLPTGSATFRVYADMLPGYKFQAAYGVPTHTLKLTTTTSWFNNTDYGATAPAYSKTNGAKNSVMLDTWLSAGAGCAANFAILKSEDDGVNNVVNNTPLAPGGKMLQNNDPSAGIPLTTQDGIVAGAPEAVTFVGFGTLTDQFDAGGTIGNSFISNNGSWASLNGSLGPIPATNKVLIGQFTTDGIFHFELNIQIGTPGGGVQNYVASSPVGAEITIPGLTGTFNAPNLPPTISITSPVNGAAFLVGQTVAIAASASDPDGTVDSVQFYVDGVKIGSDLTSPYNFNWTATVGAHQLTAKATDNGGTVVTSSVVNITVGNIIPPTVSITSPANGATFFSGVTIPINATAADADGTVDSVQFYVDGVKIGSDLTSPYTINYTAVIGNHSLTAKATDNNGAVTTSAAVSIQVFSSSTSYALISSSNKCDGNVFCLPLTAIAPVANVIGYDIVLNYNKTKVQPTGVVTVASVLINPNYTSTANSIDTAAGTMLISVFFNASAPPSAFFTGTGQLLCVEFAKAAGFGAVDTATFAIASLQESYFNGVQPKLASAGSFITYQDTIFSSSLKFWFDNSNIKYNAAAPSDYIITKIFGDNGTCTSLSAAFVTPNLSGNFNYNVNNGVAINIRKDIPGSTDVQPVINGFDAFLTRRVLINDISFIPYIYQIIAMDVNTDGVISAGDLSQINQRTVLLIPEFKQAWNYSSGGVSNGQLSKDWLFIDGSKLNTNPAYQISSTYPNNNGIGYSKAKVPVVPFCLTVPVLTSGSCQSIGNELYKGVLLGDVNGNYASFNSGPNGFKWSDNNKVVFDLSKAVINNGYADVPVTVWADETVNALDFAVQLNESNVAFSSVVNHTNYIQDLSNYNAADNTLRYTSYSLQNYESGKSLVSVRLAVKGAQLNVSDFAGAAAYLNGKKVKVELSGNNTSDNMVNVYPNPAMDIVNVITAENATVQIMSLDGSIIVLQQNIYANQKLSINTSTLSNGVYTLKIANNNFVTMKKVVIQK